MSSTCTDKIGDAFKQACEQGRFSAESYYPYARERYGRQRQKEQTHEVGFIAYDGRHVTAYGKTKAEAEQIATTLNSLKSVAAVEEWLAASRAAREGQ